MELLKRLYDINSKSGREDEIKRFILSSLSHITLDIKEDEFGNLFLTKGNAEVYPCVAAHLDEVHMPSARIIVETPPTICAVDTEGARVGLGADDKNGVWIALKLLEEHECIKVALFVEEEKDGEKAGCRGSKACDLAWFDNVGYILECDRKGANDYIVQAKETPLCDYDFIPTELLKKYKYWPEKGGNTDVAALKRRGFDKPCCNISCGYYNAHKSEEYTNIDELKNCLNFVSDIITYYKNIDNNI